MSATSPSINQEPANMSVDSNPSVTDAFENMTFIPKIGGLSRFVTAVIIMTAVVFFLKTRRRGRRGIFG